MGKESLRIFSFNQSTTLIGAKLLSLSFFIVGGIKAPRYERLNAPLQDYGLITELLPQKAGPLQPHLP